MKKSKNNQNIQPARVKRSIFVLNRGVQFKYAILLALLGGLVAALFSIHVFYFLNENIQVFIPDFRQDPQIASLVFREHVRIVAYLVAITLLLMGILFFLGIMITHRMVGPIMVLRRKMDELAKGDLSVRVRLRKGDEFSDLATSFNSMAEELQKRFDK